MNSFNHYAFGCIADWVYSVACGINMTEDSTAYKKSVISPKPDKRLCKCFAEFETSYGKISSGWEYKDGGIEFNVSIPCNTTSQIILPNGEKHEVGSGEYKFNTFI